MGGAPAIDMRIDRRVERRTVGSKGVTCVSPPGEILIGMDVGGTSTRIVALDRDLDVVGFVRLPGYATADASGLSPLPLMSEALGELAKGARRVKIKVNLAGENAGQVEAAIRRAVPSATIEIFRETTGEIALFLGTLFGCDVVVLVGTGSVALGRDGAGRRWVAGGMGPSLSDEGSGYWIGHQAIRHTLKALDRLDSGDLLIDVPEADGSPADFDAAVANRVLLRTRLEGMTRDEVAALAGSVVAKARAGSPAARELLSRAGAELADLAFRVATALDLKPPVRVLYTGGLVHAWDLLSPSITASLSRRGVFEVRHAALSGGLAVAAALFAESGVSERELVAIDGEVAAHQGFS